MQQKEGNPAPAWRSIRERIMDCLSPQTTTSGNNTILDSNKEDGKSTNNEKQEQTRSELSTVWNNYRYKKWTENSELPPLETLEKQLCDIVPRYSTLYLLFY